MIVVVVVGVRSDPRLNVYGGVGAAVIGPFIVIAFRLTWESIGSCGDDVVVVVAFRFNRRLNLCGIGAAMVCSFVTVFRFKMRN